MLHRALFLSFFMEVVLLGWVRPGLAGELSVYQAVLKTSKIRCGYVDYAPWFTREANSDVSSGIFYEITQLVGKKLALQVDWAGESGFGSFVPDLQNGKFDMLCSGGWETPSYGKHVKFSTPVFYMPVYAVVRADDTRFDKDVGRINARDVKIVTLDGDVAGMIHDEDYPQAALISVPDMTDFSQLFMDISVGKADVTFADPDTVQRFIAHNPRSVKIIKTEYPIRLYPTGLIYKNDSPAFDSMINSALRELIYSGEIHRILRKYKTDPSSYIEVGDGMNISKE